MKSLPTQKFILAASVALLSVFTGRSQAATATALVNNGANQQLLTFDTATPATVGTAVTITGLGGGETLLGIDYRPIDSLLIGLSYVSASGVVKIYSINLATGALTSINPNSLTLASSIARITADFNPTANALRVVTSAATQNDLRLPTGGTGVLTQDTDLNPANTGIRATAYSRNNAGGGTSGATTLYEIDGTNNRLVTQGSVDFFGTTGTSPNTGTLTTVATLSGVTGSAVAGFDIFNASGTSPSSPGTAFLETVTGGILSLNLSTGVATPIGTLGGTYTAGGVVDLAVLPEPSTLLLLGLAGAGLAARRRRQSVGA